MMKIQTQVLFFAGKELFHGILFVDLDIYDMLLCSHYCAVVPIALPLDGKLTMNSNISSLMKELSERPIINVGRVEIFVPIIS